MARTVVAAPGRMNRKFLLVAVLLAGLSAVLVYAKISAKDNSGGSGSGSGSQQVVVAKQAINQRTTITAEMLQIKSIPGNALVAGAFTKTDDVVGKVTKFPIEANEQVSTTTVIDTTRPTSAQALSLVVPNGHRAMSIQASQVISAGGLILPGDYVDVVWTCCSGRSVVVKTLLRNIQVAAVAQAIVNSGPVGTSSDTKNNPVAADASKPQPDASTVTLLLSPDEAQQVFLAEATGTLRVDLRAVGDQDTPNTPIYRMDQLLPPQEVATLPDDLKPDGYKQAR